MSRDSRDPYDDSDRRNGRHSANGNGPSSPSRSSRPSDPSTGRRTPPNGLIKPPLPPAGGAPRSRPSDPRSPRHTSGENYTLARMHAPRGGRVERPERDDEELPERAPRGRRGVGAMARDLSRSMSRSI